MNPEILWAPWTGSYDQILSEGQYLGGGVPWWNMNIAQLFGGDTGGGGSEVVTVSWTVNTFSVEGEVVSSWRSDPVVTFTPTTRGVSDVVHTVLDAAGLIPGVGEIADLANAALYGAEGDWGNAAISGAAMLPVVGQAAGLSRIGRRVTTHTARRMAQRGFTRRMAEVVIARGTRYWDPKNGVYNYILKGGFASGHDALVGVSPVTGEIKTVIRGTGLDSSRMVRMP